MVPNSSLSLTCECKLTRGSPCKTGKSVASCHEIVEHIFTVRRGIAGLACVYSFYSHMHGMEATGTVGLLVQTNVIVLDFPCHNCSTVSAE